MMRAKLLMALARVSVSSLIVPHLPARESAGA
jgi:hypothetical protein